MASEFQQPDRLLADDAFDRYYAEKLWEWIPAIYRHEDGFETHPNQHALRALVEILATQAAVARRSIDRLWEDQFIDLCDDWAVPYIGELVGTRLLGSLNRRGQRIDVARTIFYRRRKGTLVVMETLIQDITEWEGVVVESFRRLGRTRHRLDPEPTALTGPVTGSLPGGTANLHNTRSSEVVYGPFDDYAHTPDFRRHKGWKGRYNIPKLNFHLYRLRPYEVNFATPENLGSRRFTFDPSGRDVPLFAPDQRRGRITWTPVEEWQMPAPIPCRLLNRYRPRFINEGLSILVADQLDGATPFSPEEILGGNLESWDVSTSDPGIEAIVDPARGRILLTSDPAENVHIPRYYYGFSSGVGAGTYSREVPDDSDADTIFPDGGDDPGPVTGFNLGSEGINLFANSKTYRPNMPPADTLSDISDLYLGSQNGERPYVVLNSSSDSFTFQAHEDGAHQLVIDGLWLGFPPVDAPSPVPSTIVIDGNYERVILRNCTLDPGGTRADDRVLPYVRLEIRGLVSELVIESSILGPVIESTGIADPCSVATIRITDSIIQGSDPSSPAIGARIGELMLDRVTVFGNVSVNRIQATDTLVQGRIDATDNQHSCIRFSAARFFNTRHFESHRFPRGIPNHYFTSRHFGDPGYAQLSRSAPEILVRGAENRSEMGVFNKLLNPVKRDDLEKKVLEYMPFGLIPQFIFET